MSAIVTNRFRSSKWQTIVILTLAFWLSSSLLLDIVIMPGMYAAGMMAEPGFATAGYSIFWLFNRVELLCAGLILTGVLVLQTTKNQTNYTAVLLSLLLLTIAVTFTYGLSPAMSALGLQLDLFATGSEVPTAMNQMHQGYWLLELCKLGAGGALLGLYYRLPTES